MAPSGIYPLLSQSWFGINELKKKRNYKRMRCFRGKENAACFQRGARGWPKNHEVKQQVYKKENKVFSCDCHPVQMLMPLQRILFSTQSHLNFSTIHRSYNYMFLDAHSPNYPALRHLLFVMKTLCNGNL